MTEPTPANTTAVEQTATREDGTATAETPTVAVVAVGNEIMGDDGVGPHLIRRLEATDLAADEEVALVNAGTTGFFALEAMSGCEFAVVLDAMQTGADPGTVHEYRCIEGTFSGERPEMTMHDVSFTEALSYSRPVYDLPDEIRILGIEPAVIEPSVDLSPELTAELPGVIDMVTSYIERAVDGDHPTQQEREQ